LATGACSYSSQKWQALAKSAFHENAKQSGSWKPSAGIPQEWSTKLNHTEFSLALKLKPGVFKHVGVFPEQEANWNFLVERLLPGDRFLNLFAYTGVSSIVAAKVGADVFHVDASRSVINWAAQNAMQNGLDKIHWVCEDALKFASRELRRGNKYRGIIMDPPIYGKGAAGEHWKLENKLLEMTTLAKELLLPGGFVIVNTYSPQLPLDEMREICIKSRLVCNDMGWLGVTASDGRRLELSKYVLATAKN
jgi:23S rRNA (cytosine1962-C5)-methyltransferase